MSSVPRLLDGNPFDTELVDNTHPADWVAPKPAEKYNLVVIGGGTAGIIAALGTAGLGGKVALIEKGLLGGDCLNFGCVPSKGVLAAGHAVHAATSAQDMGLVADVSFDFATAMDRMRRQRATISHHDSAARMKQDGVDVFLGAARFTGPDTLEVDGTEIRFARACIATGARAKRPGIPGLDEAGVRTNHDFFDLTERPDRLVVVGAGPIGCEMAQAFRRFGTEVTLIDLACRILPNEDEAASELLTEVLEGEGIRILTECKVERFSRDTERHVHLDNGEVLDCDEVLIAIGRTPNIEGLNLQAAGVKSLDCGIVVDDNLRTTNPRIYASGDVADTPFKFTHAADAMSRIVIQNALFFGNKKVSDLVIPWATYTDPEVAHVGISGEEAAQRDDVFTYTEELGRNDRSLLEGEDTGYATVYADKKGQILGATIVSRTAGELIGTISFAMTHRMSLGTFANTVLPYPTRTEVLKRIAGQFQRTRLTPFVAWLLEAILRWRR